jgi:hypothetical protein
MATANSKELRVRFGPTTDTVNVSLLAQASASAVAHNTTTRLHQLQYADADILSNKVR